MPTHFLGAADGYFSVVWLVSENSEEQISSNLRKKLPRSHKVLFNVEVKILLKKQKAGEGGGDVGASHGCTKPVIREVGKQPPLNTTLWLVSGNTILSEALTGTVLYHLDELTCYGYIYGYIGTSGPLFWVFSNNECYFESCECSIE